MLIGRSSSPEVVTFLPPITLISSDRVGIALRRDPLSKSDRLKPSLRLLCFFPVTFLWDQQSSGYPYIGVLPLNIFVMTKNNSSLFLFDNFHFRLQPVFTFLSGFKLFSLPGTSMSFISLLFTCSWSFLILLIPHFASCRLSLGPVTGCSLSCQPPFDPSVLFPLLA